MTESADSVVVPTARRFRHKMRGTEYTLVGGARLQTNASLSDMAEVVVYAADNGDLWARPHTEFWDGRFEEIYPAPAAPTNGGGGDAWRSWTGGANPLPREYVEYRCRDWPDDMWRLKWSEDLTWIHESAGHDVTGYRPAAFAYAWGTSEPDKHWSIVVPGKTNFDGEIVTHFLNSGYRLFPLYFSLSPTIPAQDGGLVEALRPLATAINRATNRGPNADVRLPMSEAMKIIGCANAQARGQGQ